MELGGSDPFIVLDDADLDLSIEGAIKSRFINAGQSCIAAKRFLVSNEIIHKFIDLFLEKIKKIKTGNPLDPSIDMGPLVHRQALVNLDNQLKTALKQGARLLYGGQSSPIGKGCFFQPTLLTDVKPQMNVFEEEIFGPIASITGFNQDSEAITLANQTEFGLGASVWSKDSQRALLIGKQLECGSVAINDFVKSDPLLPFGGIKKSGIGRELAQYGLHEFVNIKSYTIRETQF